MNQEYVSTGTLTETEEPVAFSASDQGINSDGAKLVPDEAAAAVQPNEQLAVLESGTGTLSLSEALSEASKAKVEFVKAEVERFRQFMEDLKAQIDTLTAEDFRILNATDAQQAIITFVKKLLEEHQLEIERL